MEHQSLKLNHFGLIIFAIIVFYNFACHRLYFIIVSWMSLVSFQLFITEKGHRDQIEGDLRQERQMKKRIRVLWGRIVWCSLS